MSQSTRPVGPDQWAVLEPLDTVTVRDGRAFEAGQRTMARTGEPTPTTVAGALAQALGGDPRQVHGPLVVRRRPASPGDESGPPVRWEPVFPVPTDVVRADGQAPSLLSPRQRGPEDETYTDLSDDLWLLDGEGVSARGWWDVATLQLYLTDRAALRDRLRAAGLASGSGPSGVEPAPLWSPERRIGLARNADRTAAEGMLYSLEHLRTADGIGFAARCVGPPVGRTAPETVRLGGEGRRAQTHWLADDAISLPDPLHLDDRDGYRLLIYLATPALFEDGWRPPPARLRAGLTLVAVSTTGPRVISTARPDRATGGVGGSRLLWAAPAGSVYYLHADNRETAEAVVASCHGRLLTADSPFPQIDDKLITAGFGLAMVGRW